MKIFVFSSVHPWNDGRIFHRQINALKQAFDVELHAMADFDYREVNGVKVFGLPTWKTLHDRIKSIAILWRRIYKCDADIFHFHDPELLLLAPFIKIIKRKPIIYDVHEHYPLMIIEKEYIPKFLRKFVIFIFKLFERLTLPFVDIVIYTTYHVGVRYRQLKKQNAIQVGNVPSISLFSTPPPAYKERSKNAVFLGNMTPIRGLKEIIQAFNIVHQHYPDWKLRLAGRFYSETFKKQILGLVDDLNLNNVVIYEGEFSYNSMNQILYDSRIGYITYLSFPNNKACLPNKIFEYMAAGMAIIASDFENYREIIIENNCGLVVVPEDINSIANATMTYIEDEVRANQIANDARKVFLNKYNWEKEKEVFLDIYTKIQDSIGK